MTKIELLSPARDLDTGLAAILHGADAVYIGGPRFGARSSAANPMGDIERLAAFAHKYWASVYLALNTILFDSEMEESAGFARDAWNAGVDALIIQDMAFLEMDLPPIRLIASTQMNNTSLEHVRFLEKAGFQRAILARELTIEQIRGIREGTSIELEAFVHGALCTGLSGRCYLSASFGTRSANRGMCGQPCRLPWTLRDSAGNTLQENRYLLSLKDLDRSEHLAALIEAGVTSFKIEGRLKDISYVKNITALYRKRLDQVIESRPGLCRSSSGKTSFTFEPDARKTFHRGATPYFDNLNIASPETSKSTGEFLGVAGDVSTDSFTFDDPRVSTIIHNGDGLCFLDRTGEIQGMQVVKVVDGRILVHVMPKGLSIGTRICRNHDHEFLKQLEGCTSDRRLALKIVFREIPEGFLLAGTDEDGVRTSVRLETGKEPAKSPRTASQNIRKQLSRFGDTIFRLDSLEVDSGVYFLATAQLNGMRRELADRLEQERLKSRVRPVRKPAPEPDARYPEMVLDYSYNVSNELSRRFYLKHGVEEIAPAFELARPAAGGVVMTTRLCLRREMNACAREEDPVELNEPLELENSGRVFVLEFDCCECRMLLRRKKT